MVIPDIGSDNGNKQDSNTRVFNPLKSVLHYESTFPSIAPHYLCLKVPRFHLLVFLVRVV